MPRFIEYIDIAALIILVEYIYNIEDWNYTSSIYTSYLFYRADARLQLDENTTIYDDSFKLVTLI